MFVPGVESQQVHLAVPVHIERGYAFGVRGRSRTGGGGNLGQRPQFSRARVLRDLSQEKLLGPLVPEGELGLAGAEEISEHLVVVLRLAALLDEMPFPGHLGIKIGGRVFPPPDFVTLPIASKDNVEVAITVNVTNGAASLDGKVVLFDHVWVPAGSRAPVPHQGRRLLAEAKDEIVAAVTVEIGHHGAGLLGRASRRHGHFPAPAGEILPNRICPGPNLGRGKHGQASQPEVFPATIAGWV